MQTIDLIIIFTYLAGLFGFAIYIGRKSDLENYLVAGRNFKTIFLVFTMLSTMVGFSTVLATSSAAFSSGISLPIAGLIIILLGYVLVWIFTKKIKRFGDKYKAHTTGDFLAYRYSNRVRVIGSIALIVAYVIFYAALLLGLAQVFQIFRGEGLLASLVFALAGVIIYTAIAGIKSDFYTDIIHFIVMMVALVLIMLPLIIIKSDLISTISTLPTEYFNMYNFAGPSFFYLLILFGFPIFLMYMEVWQRIYASNDEKTANRTLLYSALLTVPFIVLATFAGLIARINLPNINADAALLEVMRAYLPAGILGLGIAGLIATLLSTLNSVIMVISAIFTKDFYMTFWKKNESESHYLNTGRLISLIVGILGVGVAFLFPKFVELALAANEGLLILAPAIIGGFIWKRANEKAAFYSILIGLIILWGSYAFIGKYSFIPAVITSLIVFIFFSLRKNHAPQSS